MAFSNYLMQKLVEWQMERSKGKTDEKLQKQKLGLNSRLTCHAKAPKTTKVEKRHAKKIFLHFPQEIFRRIHTPAHTHDCLFV